MAIQLVIGVVKGYLEPNCPEKLIENRPHVLLIVPFFAVEVLHIFLSKLVDEALVRARDIVWAYAPEDAGGILLLTE